jgi:hypothetical protein
MRRKTEAETQKKEKKKSTELATLSRTQDGKLTARSAPFLMYL